MHAIAERGTTPHNEPPVGAITQRTEAVCIAQAYRDAHHGDDRAALVAAVTDALTDLAAAERRTEAVRREVSRGFVRGRVTAR
ncbi:hypothetical protein ASG40_10320 [Methylobacterium sp. Leaf399]|uniref:hypothetical protein n=1 Tax=Methylobacterium sp. Leaf399 TaxID=1736364 RepID=UPI0006FE54A2|nr:hypothetical protein [Methylobacterium sp. Leaf399]KQT09048.1 hypothetical protein ASG40_10320 [Methylobacterium sp. Leaf399]